MVTAILTLLLVNTLELESISSTGSIGFLLIFAVVNIVAFRKAGEIGCSRVVAVTSAFLCLAALVALLVHNFQTSKLNLLIAAVTVATCFACEYVYKRLRSGKEN